MEMRKWLVLICILILAGALGGCEPSVLPAGDGQPAAAAPSSPAEVSSDQQAPKLFLVEPEYDAGKARPGDVVKHTFVVQNRGLGQLNIEKVKGS
jgi:hypothetical protein